MNEVFWITFLKCKIDVTRESTAKYVIRLFPVLNNFCWKWSTNVCFLKANYSQYFRLFKKYSSFITQEIALLGYLKKA